MQKASACIAGTPVHVCTPPEQAERESEEYRGKRRIQHISEEHSTELLLCGAALRLLLSTGVLSSFLAF